MSRIAPTPLFVGLFAAALAAAWSAPATAQIVCSNTAGTPPPQIGDRPVERVTLNYRAVPADGDDNVTLRTRPQRHPFDATGLAFDPVATHDVFITLTDATSEAEMVSFALPAGGGWKKTNDDTWRYKSPGVVNEVRTAVIKVDEFDPDALILRRVVARRVTLSAVPFPNHDDGVHAMIEIVDGGGAGVCAGGPVPFCKSKGAGPKKQICNL